jgi:hypothetical protein
MARPTHRLVARTKKDKQYQEIAVVWQAENREGEPIPGTFNVRLGTKKAGEECEVEITVKPKSGKPFTITSESHYLSLFSNRDQSQEDDDL